MRSFLTYIFIFFFILVGVYAVLWAQYSYRMQKYSFELPKNKTVLVVGDSQTQADINDTICSNVQNVSLAHDGYFTMYKRIKLYVEANPQINTVVVALTPHTVSPVKDEFYHNFGYIEETTKHYLPYFGLSDWWLLLKNDATDLVSSIVTPIKFYITPSQDRVREMGYYESADFSHLKEDLKEGATRLIPDSMEVDYGNAVTLEYLHKIVDYCNEKHLKLIGINTPVLHGEKYFDMENYHRLISTDFRNVEIWDDMDMEFPDSCRRDVNHLNKWGAEIYSEKIKDRF